MFDELNTSINNIDVGGPTIIFCSGSQCSYLLISFWVCSAITFMAASLAFLKNLSNKSGNTTGLRNWEQLCWVGELLPLCNAGDIESVLVRWESCQDTATKSEKK
jgi:hypothetical protein